jgi:hypothetical protein
MPDVLKRLHWRLQQSYQKRVVLFYRCGRHTAKVGAFREADTRQLLGAESKKRPMNSQQLAFVLVINEA